MKKDISRDSPEPIYKQIRIAIWNDIRKGKFEIGKRIPSERELSHKYGVNRLTVRTAMTTLVERGMLNRIQGKGTFVRDINFPLRENTEKGRLIAIVHPGGSIHHMLKPLSFLSRFLVAVEKRIHERDFHVALCGNRDNPEKEGKLLDEIMKKDIDGIIMYLIGIETNRKIITRMVKQNRQPCVIVNNYIPGLEANAVLVDNELGGYLATNHLLRVGHRRISYITDNPDFTTNRDRLAGYERAIQEFGLKISKELIMKEINGVFKDSIKTLLSLPNPPTAFFCSNDKLAIKTMGILYGLGKKVPDDVALIGFDDREEASQLEVPLTTIRQPAAEVGYAAADLLIDMILGKKEEIQKIVLEPELIIRCSCGSKHKVLETV